MKKRKKKKSPAEIKTRRIVISVIIDIVIMAVGVCVCLLPMPWRLVVPILIGMRSIIKDAILEAKKPVQPSIVHYCGGVQDKPKTRSNAKKKPQ